MAILADKNVVHPPLEAFFTIDEETGMYGANDLKSGWLKGKYLLNLDSETEGELYVGCAGGIDVESTFTYAPVETEEGDIALKVTVKDATKEQGEENPQFEISYEGWKLHDSESVLLKKPVATTTATKESPAGEYVITVSGGEAENYALIYADGTLTVTVPSSIGDLVKAGEAFDVYDMSGRKVRRHATTLNDLPKGVYIIGGRMQVVR